MLLYVGKSDHVLEVDVAHESQYRGRLVSSKVPPGENVAEAAELKFAQVESAPYGAREK